MKGKLLVLAFLLLQTTMFAQLGLTLTQTPEECIGTGQIKLTITGASSGTITAQLTRTDGVPFVPRLETITGSTHTFGSLSSGDYKVKITQNGKTAEATISVSSNAGAIANLQPTDMVITKSAGCGGTELTITIPDAMKKARVNQFALYSEDGNTEILPKQASNKFIVTQSMLGGSKEKIFRVFAYDDCKGSYISQHTNVSFIDMEYSIGLMSSGPADTKILGCNQMHYGIYISGSVNGVNSYRPDWVPADRYPLQVKIVGKREGNTDIHLHTHTINSYAESNNIVSFSSNLTSLAKGEFPDNLGVTVTDACGKIHTQDVRVYKELQIHTFILKPTSPECSLKGISLISHRYSYFQDYTIKITQAPAGFDVSNFTITPYAGGSYTITGFNEVKITNTDRFNIGMDNDNLPSGNYKFEVWSCGVKTTEKTYNLANSGEEFKVSQHNVTADCSSSGNSNIGGYIVSTSGHRLSKVEVIAAPTEFIAVYGALPYDASAGI